MIQTATGKAGQLSQKNGRNDEPKPPHIVPFPFFLRRRAVAGDYVVAFDPEQSNAYQDRDGRHNDKYPNHSNSGLSSERLRLSQCKDKQNRVLLDMIAILIIFE